MERVVRRADDANGEDLCRGDNERGEPIRSRAGRFAFACLTVLLAAVAGATAGEDPDVRRPTHSLVTGGPYAYTRNPMYLAMMLVFVAFGLIINTYWLLIVAPSLLVTLEYGVIRREERYLKALFGEEYRLYRARVRRWI